MVSFRSDPLRDGHTGLSTDDPVALCRIIADRSGPPRGPYESDRAIQALARVCMFLLERELPATAPVEDAGADDEQAPERRDPSAWRTRATQRRQAVPEAAPETVEASEPASALSRVPLTTAVGALLREDTGWWTAPEIADQLGRSGVACGGTTRVCVALSHLLDAGLVARRTREGYKKRYEWQAAEPAQAASGNGA